MDVEAANKFYDAETECSGLELWEEIEGNHDHRIEQLCVTMALRSKQDSAFLFKHFNPKVLLKIEQRRRKWLSRGESIDGLPHGTLRKGKCLFVHGHHTGENAANAALSTYKMSVVFGHTHRMQEIIKSTYDGSIIGAWTIGYLADPKPYWQHGRPNGWVHGYAVQIVSKSGNFQHINVPIVDGVSMLPTIKLG
jgi:hypothetical protein